MNKRIYKQVFMIKEEKKTKFLVQQVIVIIVKTTKNKHIISTLMFVYGSRKGSKSFSAYTRFAGFYTFTSGLIK